jgi:NADPH:quinone reductase-like Zn-dependent oxidoreductase
VFQLEFPWTPGGDVAGRVAAVGQGVVGFNVGEEVFGYTREAGAYAEFVLVNATRLAHRPAAIPAEDAAAIALVGQTATQMLDLSKIRAGQTLLIMGASGGVGSLAAQLARNAGVHVIATAHQSKAAALQDLGAERVIDSSRLKETEPVDAVLNLIGGGTIVPSYEVVRPGGVAVTSNRPPLADEAARLGIEAAFVETNVTTEGLISFARLVTEGKIKPQIAAIETLWAPATLWNKCENDQIGKIVFSIRA